MKFDYEQLVGQGCKTILTLPSYLVLQHPKTFLTVLFFRNRKPSTKNPDQPNPLVALQSMTIPGLASDPPVTIPSGMWKEWVKEMTSKRSGGSLSGNDAIPAPPPRENRVSHNYAEELRAERVRVRVQTEPLAPPQPTGLGQQTGAINNFTRYTQQVPDWFLTPTPARLAEEGGEPRITTNEEGDTF